MQSKKCYKELAKAYTQMGYNSHTKKQKELLLSRYLSSHEKVLNIGCGGGRFMEYASYGVDPISTMVEEARKNYPEKEFVISDITQTEFEEEAFDATFSFDLFMHNSPQQCQSIFVEVHRVTKKGGYFLFDVPSIKGKRLFNLQGDSWHGITAFTLEELKANFLDGWKLVAYEGLHFFPMHRVPWIFRRNCEFFDTFLCRSPFWEYSSSLVLLLEKF